jgi:hypothetical protein
MVGLAPKDTLKVFEGALGPAIMLNDRVQAGFGGSVQCRPQRQLNTVEAVQQSGTGRVSAPVRIGRDPVLDMPITSSSQIVGSPGQARPAFRRLLM